MSDEKLTLETHGAEETHALGACLADLLPAGTLLALRGELASGKTCLIQGLASRLAPDESISSPTFTLVHEYGDGPELIHIDLYRLTTPEEIVDLGYEEYFDSRKAICAVEWAERAEQLLPEKRLDLFFEHAGDDRRRVSLTDLGVLPEGWADTLTSIFSESVGR